jgi:hypothetical protein
MNVINLPIEFCMRFFNVITLTDNDCFVDVRYVDLNRIPVAKIFHFNQLETSLDGEIRKDIRKKLFKGRSRLYKMLRPPKKERPIQFNRVISPVFFKTGSVKSIMFLKTLLTKGPSSDVWSDRLVQAILKKKEAEISYASYFLTCTYLLYMYCLFFHPQRTDVLWAWFIKDYLLESIKILSDVGNGM